MKAKENEKKVGLNDSELENVKGGMDIVVDDIPSILRPIFRFFFKTKKIETSSTTSDQVITGPIYSNDNDE